MNNFYLFRFWIISFFIGFLFFLIFFEKNSEIYNFQSLLLGFFLFLVYFLVHHFSNISYTSISYKNSLKILFLWFCMFLLNSNYYDLSLILDINESYFFVALALSHLAIINFAILTINKIKELSAENILLIHDGKINFISTSLENKLKKLNVIALETKDIEKIREVISTNNLSKIIINLDESESNYFQSLINDFDETCCDIFKINLKKTIKNKDAISFDDSDLTLMTNNKMFHKPLSLLIKRLFDFSLSLILIILLIPFFILVGLLIKIESNGPVFFKQKRNGLNGKVFRIFKFRSMFYKKEEKVIQAMKNDTRVTKIGSIIRKTSIDELPQLFNIFLGEMSFIGPRPHAIEHNYIYGTKIKNYMKRHIAKPGITGLAQIHGYRGETKDIMLMRKRVEYDLEYIDKWSLFSDFMILLKTPLALFRNEAY